MCIKSIRARPHIRADDPSFPHSQIIQADFRSDSNAPIDRFEGSVAMKKIKREAKRLVEESLFTLAEKCAAARALGALIAGRWHPPPIEKRFSGRSDIQKSLLPEYVGPNRLVALISIAIKRVVPARA